MLQWVKITIVESVNYLLIGKRSRHNRLLWYYPKMKNKRSIDVEVIIQDIGRSEYTQCKYINKYFLRDYYTSSPFFKIISCI